MAVSVGTMHGEYNVPMQGIWLCVHLCDSIDTYVQMAVSVGTMHGEYNVPM